jgi:cytochrome b6-f complex subunit 7
LSLQIKFSSLKNRKHKSTIHKGALQQMGGEMLNAAMLSFGLIFVGWAIGALLLKIQGAEE